MYNSRGTLCIIDCSNTDMDEQTMLLFKQAAPVSIHRLGASFRHPTVIVESSYQVTFEKFYTDYPIKRNRYKAEKAWAKLSETDRVKAWHSLSSYKKYLSRNSWQSPMLADSYLTRKEFETEWNKLAK